MFSEFIQIWQTYRIALNNRDIAEQVIHYSSNNTGLYQAINVGELERIKAATMLEF